MPEFRFDPGQSFDDNFEEFLKALEATDPDMTNILRQHAGSLPAIVVEGERDPKKRAECNASILGALDQLVVRHESGESK